MYIFGKSIIPDLKSFPVSTRIRPINKYTAPITDAKTIHPITDYTPHAKHSSRIPTPAANP